MVVSELRGEKIDIIPFNEEPARFVAKALSPARVREVLVDDEDKQATVIVPDDQLSLAIGKEGQNARLAARLTGWRVDIRSETEFAEEEAEMGYEEEEVAGRCAAILVQRQAAARTPRFRARATAACRPTRRSRTPTPTSGARRQATADDEPRRREETATSEVAKAGDRGERPPAEEAASEEAADEDAEAGRRAAPSRRRGAARTARRAARTSRRRARAEADVAGRAEPAAETAARRREEQAS